MIDAVGPGVPGWERAEVGVGWNGGYCGYCDPVPRQVFACVEPGHGPHVRRRLRRVHGITSIDSQDTLAFERALA